MRKRELRRNQKSNQITRWQHTTQSGKAKLANSMSSHREESSSETNVYESNESLNMYLGLHYPSSGRKEGVPSILPHENAPGHGLGFPQRVARLLTSLIRDDRSSSKNFHRALDIGCAVGGSSFELAKNFDHVDAFDFSESFVKAAKRMQVEPESVSFCIPVEAKIFERVTAVHEEGVTPDILSKVNFFTGDACKIPSMHLVEKYDGIIMSNLLCRLQNPLACLESLANVVNDGGVAVIVTPYSWLKEFTPQDKWLGGFYDASENKPVYSQDVLKVIMEGQGFEKIHEEEMPLIIREHQRKYQYIISQATGWRLSNRTVEASDWTPQLREQDSSIEL